jgi:glycosyltransferase involved in cell wall biosynthesis
MNIVILSEGFPPDGGGVATSTQRIGHALQQAGGRVMIVTYQRGSVLNLEVPPVANRVDGVDVVRLGPFFKTAGTDQDVVPNQKQKALLRRRFVANLLNYLEDSGFHPDLIFSLYLLNAGFLATFIAAELGIPHVAGIRGNDIGRNIFDPQLLYATGFVIDRADAAVSVNHHLRNRAVKLFPHQAAKISVIANSIHAMPPVNRTAARQRLLAEQGWPNDALILCFIGSFREKKGCVELTGAIEAAARTNPRIRLLLISPPLGSAERLILGERLERLSVAGVVSRVGPLDRGEIHAACSGADVLVMPSIDDGLANGLLEGMAAGLCPLVSKVFADTVEHLQHGLVVDRVTPARLVEAMEWLDQDRAAVAKMGAAAREVVVAMSPEREAAAYLDLFRELHAQRGTEAGRPA